MLIRVYHPATGVRVVYCRSYGRACWIYSAAQRNGEPWAKPRAPYVGVKPQYGANLYRDNDTGRERWAVLHHASGAWYFPKHYGMRSAVALARRMNAKG